MKGQKFSNDKVCLQNKWLAAGCAIQPSAASSFGFSSLYGIHCWLIDRKSIWLVTSVYYFFSKDLL